MASSLSRMAEHRPATSCEGAKLTVGERRSRSGAGQGELLKVLPSKKWLSSFAERTIYLFNSEGMGFEPMGTLSSAELAIRFFRPLRHPSKNY